MREWLELTACKDKTDVMYPPANTGRGRWGSRAGGWNDPYVEARKICAQCPVINECFEDAMRTEPSSSYHRVGYLAGMTPNQRHDAYEQRRQARRQMAS